ncbi:hypothetical protein [Evansella cellulosilytica]|uniref:Uncharacterized protein n=1 Tax=Evansella cellulosilytica (strain ATCC 21833 / DSM 2522 / FERM P-1141 / JCM 9156 / N-4) TaxID=649639 RepID=E6TRB1_EVAC2|nr:hypothetical protein [Evansella cellulosilytica]ADU30623.1 hypothetical protein Bcell_2364 [Evansella cellulosilytica DSM 2522]
MNKRTQFIILLMFTTSLLAGCFNIPFLDQVDINVDDDKFDLTIRDEDGEASFDFSGDETDGFQMNVSDGEGENVEVTFGSTEIPEDFPAFIPIPENAKTDSVTSYTEDNYNAINVYLSGSGNIEELSDLYENTINSNGFDIGYTYSTENHVTYSAENKENNQVLNVVINFDEDNTYSLILSFHFTEEG